MNTNFNNLLISGVYWILVAIMGLFSIFGVYNLLRYGRSLVFSLVLAAVYSFFFFTLFFQSYHFLTVILSQS